MTADLKLPRLVTKEDVYRWLKLGGGISIGLHYSAFMVKGREIMSPSQTLKRAQSKILKEILQKLPVHSAAHGFVKDRSIFTHAALHTDADFVVSMDLKNFFDTVDFGKVWRVIRDVYPLRERNEMMNRDSASLALTRLMTNQKFNGHHQIACLPTGAPTSPTLSNLVLRPLDEKLTEISDAFRWVYSRYADDLTFSYHNNFITTPTFKKDLATLVFMLAQTIKDHGFIENLSKRRLMPHSQRQSVTGLIVNGGSPRLDRESRRRFRAILHNCEKNGLAVEAKGDSGFLNWLAGYANYAERAEPKLGAEWKKRIEKLIDVVP